MNDKLTPHHIMTGDYIHNKSHCKNCGKNEEACSEVPVCGLQIIESLTQQNKLTPEIAALIAKLRGKYAPHYHYPPDFHLIVADALESLGPDIDEALGVK